MTIENQPTAPGIRQRFGNLPLVLFGVLLLSVVIALVGVTEAIIIQVAAGRELVASSQADQTRAFVQLQRESLRMLALLERPLERFDADAATLQYQLLVSRFGFITRDSVQLYIGEEVRPTYEQLLTDWAGVEAAVQTWLDNPSDAALQTAAITRLTDYERVINTTEINLVRLRSLAMSDFAENSARIPVALTAGAVLFLILISAVGYALSRYLVERRENAAMREATRVKDQFLAVMSHELRTPLHAIIGFLGIVQMGGGLPEQTLHMLERCRLNADRLLALIDSILDISKLEAGRFGVHYEVVNIRTLYQRWVSQADVLAQQKGITFTSVLDANVPDPLFIDPEALMKIVTNLLSNAIKFTTEGGVNFVMKVETNQLVLTVTDTGIGIPEDARQVIFESFRQVDSSTRRAFGGTGLGLFIVKELVVLMNGTITLQSELNQGSTFSVRLPLKPLPAPTPRLEAPMKANS